MKKKSPSILVDLGLLYAINNLILRPLGHELSVVAQELVLHDWDPIPTDASYPEEREALRAYLRVAGKDRDGVEAPLELLRRLVPPKVVLKTEVAYRQAVARADHIKRTLVSLEDLLGAESEVYVAAKARLLPEHLDLKEAIAHYHRGARKR